jgi:hypothetical protein
MEACRAFKWLRALLFDGAYLHDGEPDKARILLTRSVQLQRSKAELSI